MLLGKDSKTDARTTNETTSLLAFDNNEDNEACTKNSLRYGEYSNDDLEGSDESETSEYMLQISLGEKIGTDEIELLSVWTIGCILSSSFAYGCIMTTLFLITLPIECERIEKQNPSIPKSVSLVLFQVCTFSIFKSKLCISCSNYRYP